MKFELLKILNGTRKQLLPGFFLALAILLSGNLLAQRTITGTITDNAGEPLIGASVIIQGTTQGTVTDVDGTFSITANTGDVLDISYTGYDNQQITVDAANDISVALVEGVTLQEAIVTGYSSQSRRNISGAVSVIDMDEVSTLPVSNVSQALQGKVAGVNVAASGAPGTGVSLRIRGYGTVNSNEPLYIVDGIPIQGSIQEINPNDIESIQILKDASSASIYGARAANGVVIITTRKGSVTGGANINFDMYYGTQEATDLPSMANTLELGQMLFEFQKNAGIPFSHPQYSDPNGNGVIEASELPDFIVPTAANEGDPGTSPEDYDNDDSDGTWNGIARANKTGTDWFDEVFNSSPIQSYNLSATGGNENGQYALSGGYFRQEGVVTFTDYERWSIRANTLFRVKDRVRMGENLTLSFSESTDVPGGIQGTGNAVSLAYRAASIIPVRDIMGNFAGTRGGGIGNAATPVSTLSRNKDNKNRRLRFLGNAFMEVDLIEGLTAKTSINVDLNIFRGKNFTIRDVEAAEPASSNALGLRSIEDFTWTWYNTLQYNRTFANDHTINVLIGTEAIENTFDNFGAGRVGFFSDDIDFRQLNAGGAGIVNDGNGSTWSMFSYFGKLDYDYKGKYILSATLRRDGSSRFGVNNRWGTFPAFSGAWRVSDEAFLQDASWLNDFKIRGGWGKTGNQLIGLYRVFSTFGPDINTSAYDISGSNSSVVTGFNSSNFGNPEVKWEETTSTNIGFDARMFNNHLSLEFDWYTRTTKDMLLGVDPPTLLGVANPAFFNIGEMENKGIDLALGYNSSPNQDFTYGFSFNVSHYSNEVIALADSLDAIFDGNFRSFFATKTEPGQAISSFFGFELESSDNGIFQNEDQVRNHATQPGIDPDDPSTGVGRYKFVDQNGDGTITDDDRTFLGDPHPDFSYGFSANFGYKGFDLSFFIQGVQGNELFNANKYFTDFFAFQGNRSTKVLQAWGFPGADNSKAVLPLVSQNAPDIEVSPHSYFIEDGSYLRMKNITLGYSLPDDVLSRIGLDRLRIYVQGNNLFTITDYTGIDPEISVESFFSSGADLDIGVDRGAYPLVRSFLFGINATF